MAATYTPISPVPRDLFTLGERGRWFEDVRREINIINGNGTGIDHTCLLNIGTNTHAQIDAHIADDTIHFEQGDIDHGNLMGLGDDDHTQYSLVDGSRAYTGGVEIDGSLDEIQLRVMANSTQTANIQEWRDSLGTNLAHISPTGAFGQDGLDVLITSDTDTGSVNCAGFGELVLENNTGTNANAHGRVAMRNNTGTFCAAFGNNSLEDNTGNSSSGFGHLSLQSNTGNFCTGMGVQSLQNNTDAFATGFGYRSLQNNTGMNCSAIGASCLEDNTADNITGAGYFCLEQNTGESCSGFGVNVLQFNTADFCSGFGASSLENSDSARCSAFGYRSLRNNTMTNSNGFGYQCMENNQGSNCNGFGNDAMRNNTGTRVNGFGTNALRDNTGSHNIAFGYETLRNNTSGEFNTAYGYQAGLNNITGDSSVFIGYQAGLNETASNKLYISNSSTTTPLIYGEFDTPLITINGNFETTDSRTVSVTRTTDASYSVTSTDHVIFANTDSNAVTVTLQAGTAGRTHRIVNTGTSSRLVTITPNGSEHLIGVNSSFTLNDGEALIITYDTTDGWY